MQFGAAKKRNFALPMWWSKLTIMQDNKQDKVSLVLDGKQLTLPQVRAASGAKYSDNQYTFWSKGNTAFVERDEKVIINDCVLIK